MVFVNFLTFLTFVSKKEECLFRSYDFKKNELLAFRFWFLLQAIISTQRKMIKRDYFFTFDLFTVCVGLNMVRYFDVKRWMPHINNFVVPVVFT